jgi:hypothetical protein
VAANSLPVDFSPHHYSGTTCFSTIYTAGSQAAAAAEEEEEENQHHMPHRAARTMRLMPPDKKLENLKKKSVQKTV